MAVRMVRVKPTTRVWAAATGTIISAETIRAPTIRIDSVTVRAAITAIRMFTARASGLPDRKSTRLNSSHVAISYAVFCLKKKKKKTKALNEQAYDEGNEVSTY